MELASGTPPDQMRSTTFDGGAGLIINAPLCSDGPCKLGTYDVDASPLAQNFTSMDPVSGPLLTAAVSIAQAVFPSDHRGIQGAACRVPTDGYVQAARVVVEQVPGVAMLTTGFPVSGAAETDGPPGAAAVGRALQQLGWHVVTVLDPMTRSVVSSLGEDLGEIEEIDVIGVHAASVATGHLLERVQPDVVIAVERPGLTADGRLMNMRGEELDRRIVPLDGLLRGPLSIAVGDGGNELGMGAIADFLRECQILQTPCVTSATHTLLASVSNWGAYGLVTAFGILANRRLTPTEDDDRHWLSTIERAGALDGITRRAEMTVDTFSLDRTQRVLARLVRVERSYAQMIGQSLI